MSSLSTNSKDKVSEYFCKSCSDVKLLSDGINPEYQCPNCGKRYLPKSKLKSNPKPKPELMIRGEEAEAVPSSSHNNFNYLIESMEKQRRELLGQEYKRVNDYYNAKISEGLKAIDDNIKRKKNDDENESKGSLIMSHRGIKHNKGRMTKYLKDKLVDDTAEVKAILLDR